MRGIYGLYKDMVRANDTTTLWCNVSTKKKGEMVATRFVELRQEKNKVSRDILPGLSKLGFTKKDMFTFDEFTNDALDLINIEYVSYIIMIGLILTFGTDNETPIMFYLSKDSMVHLYQHCVLFMLYLLGYVDHLLCDKGLCDMNNGCYWPVRVCLYIFVQTFIYFNPFTKIYRKYSLGIQKLKTHFQ